MGGTTYTTQATYDGIDRVASLTYPNTLVVNYAYNGPWLKQVYEGALPNPTVSYGLYQSYTALGQPGTVTYGNGVATTYSYSQASNPTCSAVNFRLCTLATAKAPTTYQNLTYGYDAGGNLASIADPSLGNQTFGYDGLDRLTSASGPYGSQTYTYSQIGNLTQNPLLGTYTYPGVASPSGRTLPHAVKNTGVGQPDFSYDNNGNLTSGAGRSLTYDFENRPLTIAKGGFTTTMVYDGDGGRVKQTVGTGGVNNTITYVNDLYVCEAAGTSSACCVNYIFAGSQLIATKRTDTGVIAYYHQDHLGSTSVVTANTAGAEQQEKLSYYPFGATRLNAGTPGVQFVDVPYKYTGQEHDSATGLYYYRARYYDPIVARFIQPDPLVPDLYDPQSLNSYNYVSNNPLRYMDPSGLQSDQTCVCSLPPPVSFFDVFQLRQPPPFQASPFLFSFVNLPTTQTMSAGTTIPVAAIRPDIQGANLGIGRAIVSIAVEIAVAASRTPLGVRILAGTGLSGLVGGIVKGEGQRSVARLALERAAKAPGPIVEYYTRLTQAPRVGQELSTAFGENAIPLANAARTGGELFVGRIPRQLVVELERLGFVQESTTTMGPVTGKELLFRSRASEFVVPFFQRLAQ